MTASQKSVTFTAIILVGLALAVLGAITAILGLGEAITLELTLGDYTVKTTSVGLAILVVGALLAGVVALRLPRNVQVFGNGSQPSWGERLAARPVVFLATAAVAVVLLVVSLLA